MSEKIEDHQNDIEMNSSEISFDNLTILKEFGNIVNLVRNEDFLETVPKAKLRRVKWVPMFNCLKQGILDEMVQEISSMWLYENMPEKLEVLEKQKETFAENSSDNALCVKESTNESDEAEKLAAWEENLEIKLCAKPPGKSGTVDQFSAMSWLSLGDHLWAERPQLGDVKAQLRASDVMNLQKQKSLLESLAKEYDARVNRLKKIVSAKRGYLKALQMDIQKYQRKNEEIVNKIGEKLENHQVLVKIGIPETNDVDEICWKEKDMEINE